MIVGYMYVLLLLTAVAVSAPISELQSPANIFARGWAENCPSITRIASNLQHETSLTLLAPTWGHTYGESYVQETLAILRDKMNKKCVKSALKSEAQNYKRMWSVISSPNAYKLILFKRSSSKTRTRTSSNATLRTSWPLCQTPAKRSSTSSTRLLVVRLDREGRHTSSFPSEKTTTQVASPDLTGSSQLSTHVKANSRMSGTASLCTT